MPALIFRRLILIYVALIAIVWIGIFAHAGLRWLNLSLVYMLSLFLFAAIFAVVLSRFQTMPWLSRAPSFRPGIFLLFAVCAMAAHWIVLGGIPMLSALHSSDGYDVARIRQSIASHGAIFNYLSPLLLKVLFPLLILKFIIDRKYFQAFLSCAFALVYAFSLLQKSFLFFVLAPACIYLFLSERKRFAIGAACVGAAGVIASFAVANSVSVFNSNLITGLANRILSIPGSTAASWFEAFPSIFPFEYGCGYRFIAALRQCTFINNSEIMFNLTSPELTKIGIFGTMNAAHFVEDYANFGDAGLILAAGLTVLCIGGASIASARLGMAAGVAINFPFIAMLSSTALHTTILSGGWLAMILLSPFLLSSGQPCLGVARKQF
jgi:hypothetical protein